MHRGPAVLHAAACLGLDFYCTDIFFISRAEDVGGLEDPVLARVQHQPPAALDPRRPECGGGDGVSARDPSVSVSERQLCNFFLFGNMLICYMQCYRGAAFLNGHFKGVQIRCFSFFWGERCFFFLMHLILVLVKLNTMCSLI